MTRRAFGLLWVLFAGMFCSSEIEAASVSVADESEVRAVVAKARDAILRGNASELLQYVSRADGLWCTDAQYSWKEAEAFLMNKNSHLYISLFDSPRFSKECGGGYPEEFPAISEQEFLRTANAIFDVGPVEDGWVQVTFTSPNKRHYQRVWDLHREDGTWKLGGASFIIGDCTCG